MTTKFRETLWFKLGDVQVEETDGDEADPTATVLALPIEDRYTGEVTAQDTSAFGLHTGSTEYLRVVRDVGGEQDVPMQTLVREMKPKKKIFAIGAGACAAIAAFVMYLV